MIRSGFGCKFNDPSYLELDLFFPIYLEFNINLRSSTNVFVEIHQFDVILLHFEPNNSFDNHLFNITTSMQLAPSFGISRILF